MTDLLTAAKAVIEGWTTGYYSVFAIEELRAAVERAESQEAAGFEEWWKTSETSPFCGPAAERAWTAAQQAERERIKNIVRKAIPEKMWVYEQAILEKIDDL